MTYNAKELDYARQRRRQCMTYARLGEPHTVPVFVRLAREWHCIALAALRLERTNLAIDSAYRAERSAA